MATPPPGKRQLLLYVPDRIYEGLREEAHLRHMSMSAIVIEALEVRIVVIDRSEKEELK